ncbi:MAG TPA: GNAT family N-acetyltransferase [Dokdonella sp.]|uniref:GNAT family N-acetyltransferase n=1 Tax=Dokdonella sp. TaxID=2291710 RepID=UPI002C77CB60|nr:GNAT family N-acetyltransferase [Dokdonella sp.]HUD41850.1 GNAT family N-acetyltransferase [Dokdonella sp.]
MTVLATARLRLRRLVLDDAPFVHELVNQPSWLAHIGDKQVHSLDDARGYLAAGPLASYAQHGFGLYAVERSHDDAPIGLCGLLRREHLDDVDIGFALLDRYGGHGYALEAAAAVVEHARHAIGLDRLVAIVAPGNARSIRLLEKLGLAYERTITLPDRTAPLRLHARNWVD